MARQKISSRWPAHVTLRLSKNVLSLRRKSLLKAFALSVGGAKRHGLKVNQFGVLGNHTHLLIEAKDNTHLSRGMQSFTIRFAKRIKAIAKELGQPIKGPVFAGRFHLHVLRTPTQVRNALMYVLFNEDKHAYRPARRSFSVFSSAFRFDGLERLGARIGNDKLRKFKNFWADIAPLESVLSPPESWLSRSGWHKA